MLQTLASVLPLAIGAAISPTITALVLGLLAQDGTGRKRAYAFWLGAAISMLAWTVIVSSFMWQVVQRATRDIEAYSHWMDLILGLLLIAVGIFRIVHRPDPNTAKKFDLTALGRGPFKRQAAFGAFAQGRNATSVILFCAAQQHIDASSIPLWQRAIVTVIVIFITTASIWLVILIPDSVTEQFGEWSGPTRKWLAKHAKRIEIAAAIGFGLYLVVRALIPLFASG